MATAYAHEYSAYKIRAKAEGNLAYAKVPCINHPVFKGKDINFDPREVFVRNLIKNRGSYNIFLKYYHELVEALCQSMQTCQLNNPVIKGKCQAIDPLNW